MEPYLFIGLPRKHYTNIARFRTSSHNLRIESGRHEKPKLPADRRTCLKCNQGIEDEIHCMLICPAHSQERQELFNVCEQYIQNFNNIADNITKFRFIMSCKEHKVLKALGRFLNSVMV